MARTFSQLLDSEKTAFLEKAYRSKDRVLDPQDYAQAMYVQDAVNMNGVVASLAELMPKIREEASVRAEVFTLTLGDDDVYGFPITEFINRHPIVRLFAETLYQKSHFPMGDNYHFAYEICSERMKESS